MKHMARQDIEVAEDETEGRTVIDVNCESQRKNLPLLHHHLVASCLFNYDLLLLSDQDLRAVQ